MSDTSPFADTASNYRERGLSVLPCGPGTKFPGRHSPAGWYTATNWQQYCDRLPSRFEMECWDRWPDAGVCLALGRSSAPSGLQLVAVDIDTDDPIEVAAIRAVLPGSPVRKRGQKGETHFYLASVDVPNRPFNAVDDPSEPTRKRRMLDLLGHGRQTVLPPSIHPGTGEPYRWITLDTLEDYDVTDLPRLPDDIAERLGAALAPFGHVDAPRLSAIPADPCAEASTHRQLNDAALADLAAWVPALGLYKCRQVGGKYKAVSSWRSSSSGRPLSKRAANLAIGPEGIKDCGEGKGYTPLDLVMAACDADLDSAFRWLQERVAPATTITLTARVVQDDPALIVDEAESFQRTSGPNNLGFLRLATVDGKVFTDTAAQHPGAPDFGIIPADLCTPPGLIGDIVEWIDASDEGVAPQLALGATLGFLGAVMGRRYAHPSRGARTNVYMIGVGPTGFGKAHALLAIKELAKAASLDQFLGPGRWKSESAVRKMMETRPTLCCLVDELGGVMRSVLDKKNEHKAGVRDILLELFSSANTTYTGAVSAAEQEVPIINPNLCIYGCSTPEDLWGNFNSGSAADGFLPRWLVFDVGEGQAQDKEATRDVFIPPDSLRKALHAILDARPRGNLEGAAAPKPIAAEWGEGALEYFHSMRAERKREIAAANAAGRHSSSIILSRAIEHTVKLSLIYAVSTDPRAPVVTTASLEWARDIVAHSSASLIRNLEGRVADTDAQAQYLWVRNEIVKSGADGVLESALIKRVNGRWDSRRHSDILGQLQASGVIWRQMRAPAGGGRPGARVGAWQDSERETG